MSNFSLNGEVALVTGGGTGLGKAIAASLLEAGAKVVITGRREEPLKETVEALGSESVAYLQHDVTRIHEAESFLEDAAACFGELTILVNNAGVHRKVSAFDDDDEGLQSILDIHLNGALALTRPLARKMMTRQKGSIIFISSMAAVIGIPQVTAYTAAKSAIAGVTKSLAVEWAPYGIRVNAIAPGWIESPMLHKALDNDPERKNKILGRTPMKRFGEASDIGNAAVFLCSPAARFITGHQLVVDGGASVSF
ncbi:MAG: SDR family oxidoreductase [Verrucomicrobiae bacterium]|nr:SDR family oxidoreductase [Verrucomicrobiae bacterium]